MDSKVAVTEILETGDPDGIIKVALSNWNGFCFRFPRRLLAKIKEYPEIIDNPTVYILAGEEEDHDVCYIGETDDPVKRMSQHSEDYWNEALIFVGSKDFPLSKATIKYLENHLYLEAKKAEAETGRYQVKNGNTPKESPLSDLDQIHALDFLSHVKTICSILGYKIFDSFLDPKEEDSSSDLFFIKRSEIDASARQTNEGMVVLKGSKTAHEFKGYSTKCFQETAKKLRDDGVIVNDVFTRDYLFKSPSGAAVIVIGHNANGRTEWKNSDGKSIKDLEDSQS
jgi:hypothetical protein